MKKQIVLIAACCCLSGMAHAVSITFDFRNAVSLYTALDDKAGPVSFTNNGLIAVFTASDGTMNRTTDGFGINSISLGNDDTDAFDAGEWMTVTFNQSVVITNVKVSSWSAGVDEGQIKIGGTTVYTVTATGNHSLNNIVPAGTILCIESTAGNLGNGWSLDSISVDTVPEPATLLLFSMGGLLAWVARRASYG